MKLRRIKKVEVLPVTDHKLKEESKYIPSEIRSRTYKELTPADKVVFNILSKTGMRISEVEGYVEKCKVAGGNRLKVVSMQPAKKNGKRLLPNLLDDFDFEELNKISLKKEALRKRISRGPFFEGYSPHDFRATGVTIGLSKDLNPVKLQALGGGKSLKSVMKYARLTTEADLGMIDFIAQSDESGTTADEINELRTKKLYFEKEYYKLKKRLEGKK